MDKVKVLAVLVVVELVLVAGLSIFLIQDKHDEPDEKDVRASLRELAEIFAPGAIWFGKHTYPSNYALGDDHLYSINGNGNIQFPVEPQWVGFMLTFRGEINLPLFIVHVPNNTWQNSGSGSMWSVIRGEMISIDNQYEYWNGTWPGIWSVDITFPGLNDSGYMLITPILWYELPADQAV